MRKSTIKYIFKNDWFDETNLKKYLDKKLKLVNKGFYCYSYSTFKTNNIILMSYNQNIGNLKFLEIAKDNFENIGILPKVKFIKKYINNKGKQHFVVLMEKLYIEKNKNLIPLSPYIIENYSGKYSEMIGTLKLKVNFLESLYRYYNKDYINHNELDKLFNEFSKKGLLDKKYFLFDVKQNDVLYDKNDNIKIIDPFLDKTNRIL